MLGFAVTRVDALFSGNTAGAPELTDFAGMIKFDLSEWYSGARASNDDKFYATHYSGGAKGPLQGGRRRSFTFSPARAGGVELI